MIRIGDLNKLVIIGRTESGLILDGEEEGELWVPIAELTAKIAVNADANTNYEVSDRIEVFVYVGTQDELVATTRLPTVRVGEFANLKVVSSNSTGAFLNWGVPKDLFLPFREQIRMVKVGEWAVVFVYLDNTGRVCASMRTEKYADKGRPFYRDGEHVALLIVGQTDLGYKAIINNRHLGVIYKNEVFQPLTLGQRTEGFIRKVRDDGKIDLSLYQTAHKNTDAISEQILSLLKTKDGFLPVGDKTSAEVIYDLLGVSKKKFKMAIGNLYKQKHISIEEDGITLKRA